MAIYFVSLIGLGLAVLGVYAVIHPQKTVDIGASYRYESAGLSDKGVVEKRIQGAIVILLGVVMIVFGLVA